MTARTVRPVERVLAASMVPVDVRLVHFTMESTFPPTGFRVRGAKMEEAEVVEVGVVHRVRIRVVLVGEVVEVARAEPVAWAPPVLVARSGLCQSIRRRLRSEPTKSGRDLEEGVAMAEPAEHGVAAAAAAKAEMLGAAI